MRGINDGAEDNMTTPRVNFESEFDSSHQLTQGLTTGNPRRSTLVTGGAVISLFRTPSHRQTAVASIRAENADGFPAIIPWSIYYNIWWSVTVIAAIVTTFVSTYQIGFSETGVFPSNDAGSILEYTLIGIFLVDIAVNFNLAFDNRRGKIVYARREIAAHYLRRLFWVDLVGVFPFYAFALAVTGQLRKDTSLSQYLGLLRLLHLVRLRRVKELFDKLQYSTRISLLMLTLIRNFAVAMVWSHFSACIMFFIAHQYGFNEDKTWIGGSIADLNGFERYLTALYWSVVTFTTVGYGDFTPVNSAEQLWGMIYMLLNIIVYAWIIGSITLLVVKHDERTGNFRDIIKTLDYYAAMHNFEESFYKRLKAQLRLAFKNKEVADEQVLSHFPSSVRRKVLRKLYLPSLLRTSLLKGIRQQFVDAFLTACNVEIFSAGEEILQYGTIASDLYLVVGGSVRLCPTDSMPTISETSNRGSYSTYNESNVGSGIQHDYRATTKELGSGQFINEIGFFTESPQADTVRTITVVKTLTMSWSAYKMIAEDHPESAGKILENLLVKVDEIATTLNNSLETEQATTPTQAQSHLMKAHDLVSTHLHKTKDDRTRRFLFAASRGDTSNISIMCDQGFDPNSADYDGRTALMVASMKGNTEAVVKLLEYNASPNLVDAHGTSALYEATRNGHEAAMNELLKHDAELCMSESLAASTLCQAVYDGDTVALRRLLRARINVNASDYDKRTAAHIAAAEGNAAAMKALVEFGADLTVKDRWDNTIIDGARRADAGHLLNYFDTLKKKEV